MDVDWNLVARNALVYSLGAGGVSTLAVFGAAWWIDFPVGLAALGLAMVAVGALLSNLRGDGIVPIPRSLVSGTRSTPTTGADFEPTRADRELVFYLSGILALSLLTVAIRLATL